MCQDGNVQVCQKACKSMPKCLKCFPMRCYENNGKKCERKSMKCRVLVKYTKDILPQNPKTPKPQNPTVYMLIGYIFHLVNNKVTYLFWTQRPEQSKNSRNSKVI